MQFPTPATLSTAHSRQTLQLAVANGLWSRFRGLMLTAPLQTLPDTQAMLITRCSSVHGFFMRYSIDVVYLASQSEPGRADRRYSVTHTTTLKPWHVSFGKNHHTSGTQGTHTVRSAHALELPAGSIERWGIRAGDVLEVHP